jgi:hypothetical protein
MKRALVVLVGLVALSAAARPPKLALFISVDSLGSNVFHQNRGRFKAGLAKLVSEGAYFPTVRYQAAECVTAAGHATLSTGANPWRHGIVGNRLISPASGRSEPIFADPGHPVLEAPLGVEDSSPIALLAETVSDRLRANTLHRAKSVTLSGKARSAIALAGKLGQPYWFHEQVGRFVTGTYYRKELPSWVRTFNEKKLPDAHHGKAWELLAPAKEYLGEDDRPFESDSHGMGRVFPHPLSGGLPSPGPQSYAALASSPMMNDLLVELAKAAIAGEELGKDDVTDLLQVSFSAVDRTYHLYGPSSWETQDHLLRLDRSVGELVAAAERAAGGRQNLVVMLTADHGGAQIPEEWASLGMDGVRVSPTALLKGVNESLAARFGVATLVLGIEETDVYLDLRAIAAKKLDAAAVRRAAASWLAKQPDVAIALSREDLPTHDANSLATALRLGFHPERSGDVLMVAEVPLLLYGRGVKPGIYPKAALAVDVAVTAAALMELGNPAMAEGSALAEALSLPK